MMPGRIRHTSRMITHTWFLRRLRTFTNNNRGLTSNRNIRPLLPSPIHRIRCSRYPRCLCRIRISNPHPITIMTRGVDKCDGWTERGRWCAAFPSTTKLYMTSFLSSSDRNGVSGGILARSICVVCFGVLLVALYPFVHRHVALDSVHSSAVSKTPSLVSVAIAYRCIHASIHLGEIVLVRW